MVCPGNRHSAPYMRGSSVRSTAFAVVSLLNYSSLHLSGFRLTVSEGFVSLGVCVEISCSRRPVKRQLLAGVREALLHPVHVIHSRILFVADAAPWIRAACVFVGCAANSSADLAVNADCT